jgi:hypothetical protein
MRGQRDEVGRAVHRAFAFRNPATATLRGVNEKSTATSGSLLKAALSRPGRHRSSCSGSADRSHHPKPNRQFSNGDDRRFPAENSRQAMSPVRIRSPQGAKRRGFHGIHRRRPEHRDWLAEEPVSSEPVSKSLNSLLTGKLIGKKHRNPGICVQEGLKTPFHDKDLQPFFLLDPNREFFSTKQGNFSGERGNSRHNRESRQRADGMGVSV